MGHEVRVQLEGAWVDGTAVGWYSDRPDAPPYYRVVVRFTDRWQGVECIAASDLESWNPDEVVETP
jgi:hypothetical protein